MPDFAKAPWVAWVPTFEDRILPILLILAVALVLAAAVKLFVHGIVKALMDREATEGTAQELSAVELKKRMDTIDNLGGNVLRFFVIVIAGLMVLRTFGLDIGPAVAGLGIVGIAVGFGAQSLVKDYLNGSLILIENQFSKGDVVRVAGVSGTVEDFSLRRTTIRDLDGVVHTVPNGEIGVASNLTRVWARINQDVSVSYGTDIDKAIEVVDTVGRDMASDPAWNRRILETPAGRSGRGPRRIRSDPQDSRDGPGSRSMVRRRRVPKAAPRRFPGQRHRDPAPAACRPRPRAGSRRRRRRGGPARWRWCGPWAAARRPGLTGRKDRP